MRAGDTYIRAGRHVAADPHLWVIISDPAKDKSQLVTVNVTSQRIDKDQSCVVQAGEHPVVVKESVVFYAGARVVPESAILAGVSAKLLKLKSAVTAALLKRIRQGAALSDKLPLAAKRLLQAQGIIPATPDLPAGARPGATRTESFEGRP